MDLPPAEVYGIASFYGMFSMSPRPLIVTHVCDDIACLTQGAEALCAEMERKHGPPGSTWLRSPCLGLCDRAPATVRGAANPGGEPAFVPALNPQQNARLIRRIGKIDPTSLEEYR